MSVEIVLLKISLFILSISYICISYYFLMKKYFYTIIIFTLGLVFFSGCEKDDICSGNTPMTPKMVIDFYEYLNPSVSKSFNKLEVYELNTPEVIMIFESTNKIKLPLRTDVEMSQYVFRLFYTNINQTVINEDLVEIRYTKEDIYISRACGYKSNFILSDSEPLTPNPNLLDIGEDEFWIKEYIVRQSVITNENETHLDILF